MGVGLVLQQQLGNIDMVVVGGHMQRGQAVLALHIRVGVLLQQQACHLDVAVLGGDVQRGEALLQWDRQKGVCVYKWTTSISYQRILLDFQLAQSHMYIHQIS